MKSFSMWGITAAILLILSSVVGAATVPVPTLIVSGDSYTRRTPCADYPNSYDGCDSAGVIEHQHSYATYLNAITKYQVVPTDNSARGGETCTVQPAYDAGIWIGQSRGLVQQVDSRIGNRIGDTVSLLIGINDVNLFGVSAEALQICLGELYRRVSFTGKKVVAMTYPGVAPTTKVWGDGRGVVASANVAIVNDAIRAAVQQHNQVYPARRVILLETAQVWDAASAGQYTLDGAHPNQKGALRLARKWFELACNSGELPCRPWFQ